MSEDKVMVVWNGNPRDGDVPGIGSFRRGVPQEVSADEAEVLLSHPDFEEATKPERLVLDGTAEENEEGGVE